MVIIIDQETYEIPMKEDEGGVMSLELRIKEMIEGQIMLNMGGIHVSKAQSTRLIDGCAG